MSSLLVIIIDIITTIIGSESDHSFCSDQPNFLSTFQAVQ